MTLSKEEENFARFALLVTGICQKMVLAYFNGYFPPSNLSPDLQAKKTDLEELKRKRIINTSQWKLLFPSTGSADSKTFDITLMICLIRNLKPIQTPVNGFDSLPPPTETIPGADLARIKYYRNYLAHRDKSEIDDVFFNTAWSEIADVVGRLGGSGLLQEVHELRIKTLDQSNHRIMTEVKHAFNEIEELKQALKDLERKPLQSLIDSTEEMMAFKMKEVYQRQTRADNKAYETLTERKVLILSGREGSGKTTMAFHLMKRIAEDKTNEDTGFTYIELKNTTDLKTVLDHVNRDNFVLLIDDPFGKSNTNKSLLDEWEKYFRDLHVKLLNRLLLVIFAIRESILSECKHELFKGDLFSSYEIVNLSSDEFVLTSDEKFYMIQKYCKERKVKQIYDTKDEMIVKDGIPFSMSSNLIDQIRKTDPVIGFPQSCHMFFSNPNIFKTGVAFFKKAREGLQEEISLLYSRTEYDKKVLAVLVFVLLEGGEIDHEKWSCETVTCQQACMRLETKVNNRDVRNVLYSEKNYFMQKDSKTKIFYFTHETILESVLMVFGEEKEDQIILLKYANESIVKEFLRSSGYNRRPGEICVVLHKELGGKLLDRLLQIYPPTRNDFCDTTPSEIGVLEHATFQDKAMGVLLLELIEKRNIINSQRRLGKVFRYIVMFNHDELLDSFWRKYHKRDGVHTEFQLTEQDIRLGMKTLFDFGDKVSLLQKLLALDPSLLNISINKNETGDSGFIVTDVVDEWTPLILYALDSNNSHRCVKFLLDQPVDLTGCDYKRENALHLSVTHTWLDVIQEIMKREPQLLNQMNKEGQTPLMKAACCFRIPNVDYLLNYPNDLLVQDVNGKTVLHLVAECPMDCSAEVKRILNLEERLINEKDYMYSTPILKAQNIKTFETILEFCPDLTVRDKKGNTALHYAAERFNKASSLIRQLVDKEPTLLNSQNKTGETPIFSAIISIKESNVQTFFDLEADLTVRNNVGDGLLHMCARHNLINAAEILLGKHMHFLNQQNYRERTPLMEAFYQGNEEFIRFLLDYDPDLTIKDDEGKNFLQIRNDTSVRMCETMICREKDIVYEKNYQLRTLMEQAVINSNVEVVKRLLRFDPNMIYIDRNIGHTLLHLAAECGTRKICEILHRYELGMISMKSEPYNIMVSMKSERYSKMTPLLVAAEKLNHRVFSYLLTHYQDIDYADNDGNTVLHYCMRNILTDIAMTNFWEFEFIEDDYWFNKCLHILQMKWDLLYFKNKEGETPLLFALISSLNSFYVPTGQCYLRWKHFSNLIMILVDNNLTVEHKTKEGENFLHLVARNPYVYTDEHFCAAIQKVADVDFNLFQEVNSSGLTPIMVAAAKKNYRMFQVFLQIDPLEITTDKSIHALPEYIYSFPSKELRRAMREDPVLLVLLIANMVCHFRKYLLRYLIKIFKHHIENKSLSP